MAWSGGSVSFSWNGSSYNVSYNAPSYSSPPSGYTVMSGPYVSVAGPGSVAANGSVSQTYEVELFRSTPFSIIYSTSSISGTAPSAPAPPSTVSVPGVTGLTSASAMNIILNAGLNPSGSYQDTNNSSLENIVLSQSPTGGTQVNPGSTVSYTIGNYVPPSGPTYVNVPNVAGMTEAQAESAIINAGLSISNTNTTNSWGGVPATAVNHGTAAGTSPAAGTSVVSGSTVVLVLYNYTDWLKLTASVSLSSDYGTPEPHSYSYSYRNVSPSDVVLSVETSNGTAEVVTAPGGQNTTYSGFFPSPGNWFSSSYGTTYTITISGTGPGGLESVTASRTTSSAPVINYPPSWAETGLATFRKDTAYSDGVLASGSGSISYSVSSGSLPAGISLNSSSGAVTGTPTTLGAYSFTISATSAYGGVSASYSGTVRPAAGQLSVYDGTGFITGEVYVYDGTTWGVKRQVHVRNSSNTAWVLSD